MAVLQGGVEIVSIFFSPADRTNINEAQVYPGPELSTLPEEVTDAMNTVLDVLGVSTELLMNTVLHSAYKVDEIDTLWLRDLHSMME